MSDTGVGMLIDYVVLASLAFWSAVVGARRRRESPGRTLESFLWLINIAANAVAFLTLAYLAIRLVVVEAL